MADTVRAFSMHFQKTVRFNAPFLSYRSTGQTDRHTGRRVAALPYRAGHNKHMLIAAITLHGTRGMHRLQLWRTWGPSVLILVTSKFCEWLPLFAGDNTL